MTKYYVYLHLDSQGKVFYVGCGKRYRPTDFSSRTEAWKQRAKNGVQVVIMKTFTDRREALDLEYEYIDIFRNEKVINTLGWDDPLLREKRLAGYTFEVRRRMSEAHKGRKLPESQRSSIKAALHKVMATPEWKEKHKAAMNRPDVIRKRSEAMKGHTPWNKGLTYQQSSTIKRQSV